MRRMAIIAMVYDVGNFDRVGDGDDNVDDGEEDPIGSVRHKKVEKFSQNSRDDDEYH